MRNYRQLAVWQKAHIAAVNAHRATEAIPPRGNAELISQIRRAALSIPSNIAEGCGRSSDQDFAKFVQIAIGSTTELEYQLDFAAEIGRLKREVAAQRQAEVVEVRRMLIGLLKKLRPPVGSEAQRL
jgi:four helix bundle protein